MTTATTTYVTAPSHEQLETAWWNLMQGELGISEDSRVAAFFQAMFDHVRDEVAQGVPVMAPDGEPLNAVSGDEMAKRMVAAYAALFYGAGE
jgi:hypothetical protein